MASKTSTNTRTSAPTVPMAEVTAEFAARTGLSKKKATSTLDDFVSSIVKHLKKGRKVHITGLGILQVRHNPTRSGRNPAAESIDIKAPTRRSVPRAARDHLEKAALEQSVISRVERLVGDRQRAQAWFDYQPLPAFENKTPRELVAEGRSAAVQLHLDTLEDGVYA